MKPKLRHRIALCMNYQSNNMVFDVGYTKNGPFCVLPVCVGRLDQVTCIVLLVWPGTTKCVVSSDSLYGTHKMINLIRDSSRNPQ